jgi:uncharacterized protein with von Willebrand factor type A (vWA) domain
MSAAREEAYERWGRRTQRVPAANHRMLGQQVAEQTIIAQCDAGMSPGRIAEAQDEIATRNLSEATTREGRIFATEYDSTARILVRELQEMEAGE